MHAKAQRRTKAEFARTGASAKADYTRSVCLPGTDGATALAKARNAFGREGFAVVAEIDLRDTLQRMLDKDVGPYWILELCNPNLADRVLAAERNPGLLMPCKVAVWQEGKDAKVAALRPEVAASVSGSKTLSEIAREAERHIEGALVHLEAPERDLPIGNES